ncbi:MAG: hypothetical protein SFX72_16230 [Isosphaeraceae bacterium]|nr:hypothetical protein [Isosphaeraceae bacterium]
MEGWITSPRRAKIARKPGLESLEGRIQLSTATPFPTSGPLNGWLFKLVATKGQEVPDGAEGDAISGVTTQSGSISSRAQSSFAVSIEDAAGASEGEGLYVTRFGPRAGRRTLPQPSPPLRQVVRTGQAVPGGEIGTTLGPSIVNNSGRVAFASTLTNAAVPAKAGGVYVLQPRRGVLSGVAVPLDVLSNGSTFQGPNGSLSFNNRNQVAFTAYATSADGAVGFNGSTTGTGVFLANGLNRISTIAAPGTRLSDGTTIDYAADPSVTETKSIAFVGHVAGTPALVDPADPTRLLGASIFYVRSGDSISPIARQGQVIPALQGGGTISFAADPIANNRDQVLFHASTSDATQVGVYQFSPNGGLVQIAGPGDTLPDGSVFVTAPLGAGTMGYNDRGEAAFVAQTSQGSAIYASRNGTLVLVAKEGDVIPGLGLGSITSFTQPGDTGGPFINANHQVLFAAQTSIGGSALFSATSYRRITKLRS